MWKRNSQNKFWTRIKEITKILKCLDKLKTAKAQIKTKNLMHNKMLQLLKKILKNLKL